MFYFYYFLANFLFAFFSTTLFDLDYFAINFDVNNNDNHINVIELLHYHR